MGKIVAVCSSERKGTRKKNIGRGLLMVGFGLAGDAHGGAWHRQVSLLAMESIEKMRRQGLNVGPGDFAENLTTAGIDIPKLPVGTRLQAGEALLEVTQIGKTCHTRCAVYHQAGDCVMPREGIFARVLTGGEVQVGDEITVIGELKDNQADSAKIRAGIVTLSDKGSRGEREDQSGLVIRDILLANGIFTYRYQVLPDEKELLKEVLLSMCDGDGLDLVLTTGGTGLSPRDITPEATKEVIEREVPGLAEAMRAESLKKTPHAMLSRAVCGIRGQTLIVNLPGSPKAAAECLTVIMPAIPHAVEVLRGEAYECANMRK